VTLRRAPSTVALTITALAVVIASATWAYSTFDFWGGGPILASVCALAAAAGGAVYVATRRRLLALVVAVFLGSAHFVLLLAITLARWEG
jgi:peptidoglycan/LPS O-acetylase OafA/YrhL